MPIGQNYQKLRNVGPSIIGGFIDAGRNGKTNVCASFSLRYIIDPACKKSFCLNNISTRKTNKELFGGNPSPITPNWYLLQKKKKIPAIFGYCLQYACKFSCKYLIFNKKFEDISTFNNKTLIKLLDGVRVRGTQALLLHKFSFCHFALRNN